MKLPLACSLAAVLAFAQLAHAASNCEIEDWRWRQDSLGGLWIEGATSCASEEIFVRAYDGDRFLGTVSTYIRGYTFEGVISDVAGTLKKVSIRYSILGE